MLQLDNVESFYGASQALFGIDLTLARGEVLALMGRNGMGKTTTVRSLVGLLAPRRGRVVFDGHEVQRWPAHRIARLGIGLVPEGRQVFPLLDVQENLLATARAGPDGRRRWTLQAVYALFPRLAERARQNGATLSGGEQQMLAIGRALMTNPRLLVLDEATEGLAPLIRQEIWHCLAGLKAEGQAILVIDKNLAELGRVADRCVVLEKGRVAWQGTPQALADAPTVAERYLGV